MCKVWRRFSKNTSKDKDSVMKTLTNLVWCCRKLFIHKSTCTVGKDLVRRNYQRRKNFTAIWQWKSSQMLINIKKKCLGRFWNKKSKRILWSESAEQNTIIDRCIRKYSNNCTKIPELNPVYFLFFLINLILFSNIYTLRN